MDITVTRQYKDRNAKSRDYVFASSSTNTAKPPLPTDKFPEPLEIIFTETNSPEVIDYDEKYSTIYGNHPTAFLLIENDDDEDKLETQHVPKRYFTEGKLTRLLWDLGDSDEDKRTGLIILKK